MLSTVLFSVLYCAVQCTVLYSVCQRPLARGNRLDAAYTCSGPVQAEHQTWLRACTFSLSDAKCTRRPWPGRIQRKGRGRSLSTLWRCTVRLWE